MAKRRKLTLTTEILVAMIAGALVGVLLNWLFSGFAFVDDFVVGGIFSVIGGIFISALKMLVVPLVFVSLVCGVTTLGDVAALGRIGLKALVLYLFTTAVAITIALTVAGVVAPGEGFVIGEAAVTFEGGEAPPLRQVITDLVPSNPVAAFADGNMLQIIVFAIFFGIAMTLAGARGRHVQALFDDLNEVIMRMVGIVMRLAPIGVFCLIARTFATQGIDVILPLASYFLTVVAALLLHALGVYSLLLTFVGRLDPVMFFRKMRAPMVFAFSTASSNATIPVTLDTVEHRLGVRSSVAAFTVPLGATINMDGTAIMQGVATVFIGHVYGADLGLAEYLTVVLTATLASIGTAGVPGVGLIMLSMVLIQVGLPVEGIALIIGVDRLLDMMRTAVNITGDSTVTCLIAKSEKAFDHARFADPAAGVIEGDVPAASLP
jgi:DAACS family dicarboxylate/amino acid:cation (Na+ or H+) symporter